MHLGSFTQRKKFSLNHLRSIRIRWSMRTASNRSLYSFHSPRHFNSLSIPSFLSGLAGTATSPISFSVNRNDSTSICGGNCRRAISCPIQHYPPTQGTIIFSSIHGCTVRANIPIRDKNLSVRSETRLRAGRSYSGGWLLNPNSIHQPKGWKNHGRSGPGCSFMVFIISWNRRESLLADSYSFTCSEFILSWRAWG
jgi:hypothetical protein